MCEPSDDGTDSDVDIEKIEACTTSTNASDDYANRGQKLSAMCFYVYRMYVRRVRKRSPAPNIFGFEKHYVLAQSYVQEVVLHNIHVPTIDGFHCPTVVQDAEQNALLKTILFSPWSCTDPMTCGSAQNFRHLLSDGTGANEETSDAAQLTASSSSRDAPQLASLAGNVPQLPASSSSPQGLNPQLHHAPNTHAFTEWTS